ncbi:MAG: hypothetical protein KC457_00995 [Myxococcales bacterium]|nr:hypothetical protein [Myxococcales bacterium]
MSNRAHTPHRPRLQPAPGAELFEDLPGPSRDEHHRRMRAELPLPRVSGSPGQKLVGWIEPLHRQVTTDRTLAAAQTLPSFTAGEVDLAMRKGHGLGFLVDIETRVREFAIRNAQQTADESQQPVRCEVEVEVNGERETELIGLVHPGDPCQHCGTGYRRDSKGQALEPGESFPCTCCDGRGYIGGGLRLPGGC